jgi:hypothetical protein
LRTFEHIEPVLGVDVTKLFIGGKRHRVTPDYAFKFVYGEHSKTRLDVLELGFG